MIGGLSCVMVCAVVKEWMNGREAILRWRKKDKDKIMTIHTFQTPLISL
jgi:hypothetical protein